uniref:Uncharacterized protein LOC114334114 n=1 Tax=Diabrotica virgifera virgifera TaxID=50390 RepID=A0A6P7FYN2_DIAVI
MSYDFNNLFVIVRLFLSYVRSLLEYCSVIWSPSYENHKYRIESIQNKFVRYLRYRLGTRGMQLNSSQVMQMFHLHRLEDRRRYFDLNFVFKVLNGIIVAPSILGRIDFYVPARNLRRCPLLSARPCNTRHAENMPLNKIVSSVNEFPNIDFMEVTLNAFKRTISRESF